ncbi:MULTISPECIES: recombinase family protein [Paraburkholderia]|jgi:DNA invertase Pin-like site-specific DNA recombinase|uniref:recombinase family protein n=1 Tax=Paraburkholderia TaxID=1822464 RepID=UPI0038B88A8C
MTTVESASAICSMPTRAHAAAQYIRMSTDQQQFSPDAQKQAISEYAKVHGIQVVRTHEDAGLSGLTLRERSALVRLLIDVRNSDRDFDTVLVLDISRWGRFQGSLAPTL